MRRCLSGFFGWESFGVVDCFFSFYYCPPTIGYGVPFVGPCDMEGLVRCCVFLVVLGVLAQDASAYVNFDDFQVNLLDHRMKVGDGLLTGTSPSRLTSRCS